MENQMVAGSISCLCGQIFHVETIHNTVDCIRCGKAHSTEHLPKLEVEEPQPEQISEE